MGIKITNLDEFGRKLTDIARRFPQERDRFLKMEAELIKDRAKMHTPLVNGQLRNAWDRTQPVGGRIDIYNNTEYAAHVEWGHRQRKRWVPGYWSGDQFIYDPSAKTGMMLSDKFVEGAKMLHEAMDETEVHIRDDAKRILRGLFQ